LVEISQTQGEKGRNNGANSVGGAAPRKWVVSLAKKKCSREVDLVPNSRREQLRSDSRGQTALTGKEKARSEGKSEKKDRRVKKEFSSPTQNVAASTNHRGRGCGLCELRQRENKVLSASNGTESRGITKRTGR